MWPQRCRVTARGSRSPPSKGATRLWVFPLDPVARRLGSGKPLTEDDARRSKSALSPDGRFVAYNLTRPGIDRDELWITNIVDGTSELVATTDLTRLVARRKGDRLHLSSTRQASRSSGATAVRQLGGKERFVSRWSTNLFIAFRLECGAGSSRDLRATPSRRHVVGTLADDESRCRQAGPGTDLQAEHGFLAGAVLAQWPMAELCRHKE